jgi:uncharacterized membrane protein YfcA
MPDIFAIAAIAVTFLLAGTVKGVIGLGLPTVSLALLTLAFDLTQAMALLLVPSFVTNVWQAAVGGNGRTILRRLWPFLFMATAAVWLGAMALSRVDLSWLTALLGLSLAVYAATGLTGFHPTVAGRHEKWLGPLFGGVNGVLTGMTGSFAVPGVMYLQAIGLPRDALIQAMGVLFTISTLALALALGGNGLLNAQLGTTSLAAIVPAVAGMFVGQRIRRRLPEAGFRRAFYVALLVLGAMIVARSAGLPG